jgi:hypothetical protein
MSMIRPIARLAAIVMVLGLAGTAAAQRFEPFIDPGYFDPDFQFFAPAEVGDFGGQDFQNTGVYFDYDKMYVAVTRPNDPYSFQSQHDSDFTWGNRYEIGYMTEEDNGWQAIHWHLSGPAEVFDNALFVRLIDGMAPGGGAITHEFLEPFAVDTVNAMRLSSLELNKTWRRKQFHHGAVLEPLIGYRYMNLKDRFQRQTATEVLINVPPNVIFFDVATQRSIFENEMHGGQLGARLFRQQGHWLLSVDVRFFAMANFQNLALETETSTLQSPNDDTVDVDLVDIDGQDVSRTLTHQNAAQFVWGGEVRAEAAYELTRDVSLRFGMIFFDLGQGIGRGNIMADNNQDVQIAGLTFGLTINR